VPFEMAQIASFVQFYKDFPLKPYDFQYFFVSLQVGKKDTMKKEIIQQLYSAFEQAALEVDGVECWSARELQTLLGYSKWENFANVINKAKIACENVGHNVSDHFPDVRKTIPMPKGAEKEINSHFIKR
jgi:DNA-damage-inducible protein D